MNAPDIRHSHPKYGDMLEQTIDTYEKEGTLNDCALLDLAVLKALESDDPLEWLTQAPELVITLLQDFYWPGPDGFADFLEDCKKQLCDYYRDIIYNDLDNFRDFFRQPNDN